MQICMKHGAPVGDYLVMTALKTVTLVQIYCSTTYLSLSMHSQEVLCCFLGIKHHLQSTQATPKQDQFKSRNDGPTDIAPYLKWISIPLTYLGSDVHRR